MNNVHDYGVQINGTYATVIKDSKLLNNNPQSSLEILEILKNASSIEIPSNTNLKGIVTDIKMVALEESTHSWGSYFTDILAKIFGCFGIKTTAERIESAASIVPGKVVLAKIDEESDEISTKLSSKSTYKEALPLILKLSQEEIAQPYQKYFEACLKYNDDEAAKAALEKCLISFKLASTGIYDDLEYLYNSWKSSN